MASSLPNANMKGEAHKDEGRRSSVILGWKEATTPESDAPAPLDPMKEPKDATLGGASVVRGVV